ncbi:MAG: hypothetical protein ACOYLO_03560 [Ferruginibacter sp.]
MTDTGIYYPENMDAQHLDILLSKGWYRMGQGIFTTKYIIQENIPYRVFWLRYNLNKIILGKKQQKLLQKNKIFNSNIIPFKITDELEKLYALYKTEIDFEPASSVTEWMLEEKENNVYDSWIIEIRDKGLLIAAGIFDKGKNSIAGIMNFYHPDYKKYSLGKYLMLLKIAYAKEAGNQWYYPGYLVYGYPKFDYKVFADKSSVETFLPELNQWCLYDPAVLRKFRNNEIF